MPQFCRQYFDKIINFILFFWPHIFILSSRVNSGILNEDFWVNVHLGHSNYQKSSSFQKLKCYVDHLYRYAITWSLEKEIYTTLNSELGPSQSFPYENHCKCYKKLASRLWPVLYILTHFFLIHTLSSSAGK